MSIVRDSLGRFVKGCSPNVGKKHGKKTKEKMSKSATGKIHPWSRGKNNNKWVGGRSINKGGYVLFRAPEHPSAHVDGYILEHRMVMEDHLGRRLERWEYVHHKNGKKDDNRIENLEVVFANKHFGKVRCPHCLEEFLIK